uniref:Uncharacterized protein n=1 Tax=Arundo donax TaxID=35708 RepID=A0A0A9CM58_ARUDO
MKAPSVASFLHVSDAAMQDLIPSHRRGSSVTYPRSHPEYPSSR